MPYAICTVSAAPVRNEPSHRSEMTSQLLFGETVVVLEEKEEWFKVKGTYDGYEGWTARPLLAPFNEGAATATNSFITTGLLNAIQCGNDVFQIPMGCSLTGFNESNHCLWNKQYTYEGSYRNTQQPYTRALFQNTIRPWLHVPYLWGGKTFMGVDCSGFVQTVFKIAGVPLLRDAYQQAEQGTTVAGVETMQEGDLAFFKNESGKIIHVGIVLANMKIIHASGTVRIDNLTKEGIFKANENKQTHHLHSIKRIASFAE